ncbi:MAG TPA: glutathione S-transferase family protein [Burkholderiaceae bacterium]|nr:glutathione S-transferase family protein [Burkholderiaceae bacterium]
MTTITLYHSVSARSFRPLWALEELELDYELVMLEFPPRVLKRDFLDVNPLGTVPALTAGDIFMTESVAMCQYLASLKKDTELVVRDHEPDFASYLNYLYYGEATLTFPQTLVLRYQHFESPERQQPGIAQDYAKWFIARTRLLDHALGDEPWLCAGRFTLADISVGFALMLADHVDLLEQTSERVQTYWQGLQEQPAFKRALQREHDAAVAQGISTLPVPALRPHLK